jgi:hypothetical protein
MKGTVGQSVLQAGRFLMTFNLLNLTIHQFNRQSQSLGSGRA